MQIVKANCPSCGAPLSIPDDRDAIYCSACGSSLVIERSESYVTLKFAEKLVSAIEQSGNATQNAIRENAYVTRTELQRLQANQELSTLQLQLSNLQAEMRTMERSPSSLATIAQKLKLHQSEYELLDRMYAVHKRISTPDPANLQARIDFANWEISWFQTEIVALSASNHPSRFQLIKTLNARKIELASTIAGLKVNQFRNRLSSFTHPDPTPSDLAGIAALLALVAADEQNARAFPSSSEGKLVYNEIVSRQQRLKSWLVQGDRKQIGEMLVSPNFRANPENMNSLHELLVLINRDLQIDFGKFEVSVAQQYQKALLDRKNQTDKQIKRLEFRLQNGRDPGLFPAIIAAITAGIAGLAGLFAAESSQSSRRDSSSPSQIFHSSAGQVDLATPAVPSSPSLPSRSPGGQLDLTAPTVSVTPLQDTTGQSKIESVGILPSIPVNQPRKASGFVSTGLGCLAGLAITVVISFIGFIILALVLGGNEANGWYMSIVFLFTIIGLDLGAFVFLWITAPGLSLKGFGPLPRIPLIPKRAGKGIQNIRIIKVFLGLITCTTVYLIFLGLMMGATEISTGLSAILLIVGFMLGPVLAILFPIRVTIS